MNIVRCTRQTVESFMQVAHPELIQSDGEPAEADHVTNNGAFVPRGSSEFNIRELFLGFRAFLTGARI